MSIQIGGLYKTAATKSKIVEVLECDGTGYYLCQYYAYTNPIAVTFLEKELIPFNQKLKFAKNDHVLNVVNLGRLDNIIKPPASFIIHAVWGADESNVWYVIKRGSYQTLLNERFLRYPYEY